MPTTVHDGEQYLEVLLLNQKLIHSVIDSCQVALLHCNEIVLDQGQVVCLT